MGLLGIVKSSLGTARKLWEWKRSREFEEVKSKVLRHAERSQAKGGEGYWHTAERLVEHGVIEPWQLEAAKQVLQAFVHDGYFECHDGRYYLKGDAPKSPYR